MIEIPLTQDKKALIDDEDFEKVNQYNWFAVYERNTWYAKTGRGELSMGRLILNVQTTEAFVDHIDGNGLNYQKYNLRICNNHQNVMNQRKRKGTKSKYKGVWEYVGRKKKWVASIKVHYRKIPLGYFYLEEDAARAYDEAAKEYFGEFARLNFPQEVQV